MPYAKVWQEPEFVLEHAGIKVYAVYEDEDVEQQLSRWFTTDPREHSGGMDSPFAFPIFELKLQNFSGGAKAIIRRAIDAGLIRVPEDLAVAPTQPATIDHHSV